MVTGTDIGRRRGLAPETPPFRVENAQGARRFDLQRKVVGRPTERSVPPWSPPDHYGAVPDRRWAGRTAGVPFARPASGGRVPLPVGMGDVVAVDFVDAVTGPAAPEVRLRGLVPRPGEAGERDRAGAIALLGETSSDQSRLGASAVSRVRRRGDRSHVPRDRRHRGAHHDGGGGVDAGPPRRVVSRPAVRVSGTTVARLVRQGCSCGRDRPGSASGGWPGREPELHSNPASPVPPPPTEPS